MPSNRDVWFFWFVFIFISILFCIASHIYVVYVLSGRAPCAPYIDTFYNSTFAVCSIFNVLWLNCTWIHPSLSETFVFLLIDDDLQLRSDEYLLFNKRPRSTWVRRSTCVHNIQMYMQLETFFSIFFTCNVRSLSLNNCQKLNETFFFSEFAIVCGCGTMRKQTYRLHCLFILTALVDYVRKGHVLDRINGFFLNIMFGDVILSSKLKFF